MRYLKKKKRKEKKKKKNPPPVTTSSLTKSMQLLAVRLAFLGPFCCLTVYFCYSRHDFERLCSISATMEYNKRKARLLNVRFWSVFRRIKECWLRDSPTIARDEIYQRQGRHQLTVASIEVNASWLLNKKHNSSYNNIREKMWCLAFTVLLTNFYQHMTHFLFCEMQKIKLSLSNKEVSPINVNYNTSSWNTMSFWYWLYNEIIEISCNGIDLAFGK